MIGLFMAAQDEAHSARRLSNLPVSLCAQPAMQSETTRRSRGGDEERTRPANDSLGRWGHHRPGDNPRALELLAGNSGEGRAPPRGHRTRSGPVCRDLGSQASRCRSSSVLGAPRSPVQPRPSSRPSRPSMILLGSSLGVTSRLVLSARARETTIGAPYVTAPDVGAGARSAPSGSRMSRSGIGSEENIRAQQTTPRGFSG